jgi:hypothetical protein
MAAGVSMEAAGARLSWLRGVVVLLAVCEGGWLAFDGTRALVVGDYVTPASGPYAGQLGPWAAVVSAAGIDPRSTLMKSIHVALGTALLAASACFARRLRGSWWGLIACAACGLWYLPVGTALGAAQLVLLLLPALRRRS